MTRQPIFTAHFIAGSSQLSVRPQIVVTGIIRLLQIALTPSFWLGLACALVFLASRQPLSHATNRRYLRLRRFRLGTAQRGLSLFAFAATRRRYP